MARAGVTGDTVMRGELEPSPMWGCLRVAIPISPQSVTPGLGWQSRAGESSGL